MKNLEILHILQTKQTKIQTKRYSLRTLSISFSMTTYGNRGKQTLLTPVTLSIYSPSFFQDRPAIHSVTQAVPCHVEPTPSVYLFP
jgi:hypothetical protein